jgi:GTP-binding protein HflX
MHTHQTKNEFISSREETKALLIATYQGVKQKPICEEHLNELSLLAETYGVTTVHKEACSIRKYDASLFIGSGKIQELSEIAATKEVNVIIFDDEITPAQQRNLQKAFNLSVIDRTELILGVFAQRAHTKEARLQIELAKVQYESPRLKRLWTHLSRQKGTAGGGGGAYLKGEGEKQIEIDRRILKKKIVQLQKEILEVKAIRETQRISRVRSKIPIFAIIGYTNAGKSTLLHALTQAEVLIEDKLFATLDTTTRKFMLSNQQEILLIDTVGFIRKLPHLLVAAFKSTLEEAIEADILLHLIDVSHPMAEEQAKTTFEVLKELGAVNKKILTVLNKVDREVSPALIEKLCNTYPNHVQISALTHQGLDQLQEKMIQELREQRVQMHLRIPQSEYKLVNEIRIMGQILQQEYDENYIVLHVQIPFSLTYKLSPYEMKDFSL